MALVFISYETTTGLGFSKHLKKSLLKHDITSFLAEVDIAPGKAPFKTIQEKLKESRYFVLVLTITALKSPEVRKEFSLAKDSGKHIIPCVKDGLESYVEKEFKEVLDFQYIQFKTKEDLANCVIEAILKQRIIDDKKSLRELKDLTRKDAIDSRLDDLVTLETEIDFLLTEPDIDPKGEYIFRMKTEHVEKRKQELLQKFIKEIIDSGGSIVD